MGCPIGITSLITSFGAVMLLQNHALCANDRHIQTLLVVEPSEAYPRHSEGDIVELRDGRLCLVYTRFTGGGEDHAKADIVALTSGDGGKTWSDSRVLIKNEGEMNVMSVSILRLAGGELLLFYLRKNSLSDCNLYVRRSADDLSTLSEPVRVTTHDGYNVVNNDRVIRLSTGRIVVPSALHGHIGTSTKNLDPYGRPHVLLSDDAGRSWRADKTMVDAPPDRSVKFQEPGVMELRDGRLLMWMRTDGGVQYECFSKDGGEHWTTPVKGVLASPVSPATIERVPWTGDLLCVWNDHSGWHAYPKGRRTPLCLAISKDDGRTWGPSRVLEGDPDGWYCYTSMAFAQNRVILAYCAGDRQVGGLNRLKVAALSRDWLYPKD